jgi:WD40 repeat protein
VRLWDVETGKEQTRMGGDDKYVMGLAFSPDGKTVATTAFKGTAKLWDCATGRLRLELPAHDGYSFAVAFSPDGTTLATGGSSPVAHRAQLDVGEVRLWDPATGRSRGDPLSLDYVPWSVAFSLRSGVLAAAGGPFDDKPGTTKVWDTTPRRGRSR